MYAHDRAFGHRIWCDISVAPKEVLEPTSDHSLQVVSEQTKMAESQDHVVGLVKLLLQARVDPELLRKGN